MRTPVLVIAALVALAGACAGPDAPLLPAPASALAPAPTVSTLALESSAPTALPSPSPVVPPVAVRYTEAREVERYAVQGRTPTAIRASLDHSRPTGDAGPHDAYTYWYVEWRYEGARDDRQRCTTGPISVHVRTRVVLPSLAPGAPDTVASGFERYLERLAAHEQDHVDLALATGREVGRALEALAPESTCAVLRARATAVAGAALERGSDAQREYDVRTRHGATQGAHYP